MITQLLDIAMLGGGCHNEPLLVTHRIDQGSVLMFPENERNSPGQHPYREYQNLMTWVETHQNQRQRKRVIKKEVILIWFREPGFRGRIISKVRSRT